MPPRGEEIRSQFDTSVGVVYYNVPGAEIPEIQERISSSRRRRHDSSEDREAYLNLVRYWVQTNHFPLFVHEWAHVIQAITHPALLHRCLRELSLILSIPQAVLLTEDPLPLPLLPPESWYLELNMATHQRRLSIDLVGEPHIEESSSRWQMPNDLSEIDLLEDSASIFQYKAEIGGPGSARLYANWLNEEYRYSRTFEFLADVLGEEDGYVGLPALVMAANTTNWPVDTFISLLAATRRYAIRPAELGVDRYWEFLTTFLRHKVPEGDPLNPRDTVDADAEPVRFGREQMLKMAADLPLHPISAVVRQACADDAQLGRLRETVFHPYRSFDRHSRVASEWLYPFEPPVALYRVFDGEAVAGDTLMALSSTLLDEEPPVDADHWVPCVLQLIRAKAFSSAAVRSQLTPESHRCRHIECPHHSVGLCSAWMEVPISPDECAFPDWMRDHCGRRWDFEKEVLMRVAAEDA